MRPMFRRNLIQRFIRFLVVSDNVQQKEVVTERLKIYFTLLNSLDAVYIQNYVCSVHEFWHLFAKMRDLPSVKTLIQNWKRTCQDSRIDVSWNKSKRLIIFGSDSLFLSEDKIREKVLKNSKAEIEQVFLQIESQKWAKGLGQKVLRRLKKIKELKMFKVKYQFTSVNVRKYSIDWIRHDEKELFSLLSVFDETEIFNEQFIMDILKVHRL